ncbi:DUF1904 domain-containing protein [Shewanella khirikhana]|jgi:hypothetical protein|uniref:DUF1904 domain-containing protein n=1 Tax=Shewanella khirikhana TaxID=1965282 RepID=A0ABM7DNC5_9GAMM|nr:DUF1904 domain-containing protein [Shewanella khirikhana]AZQ10544.1 hypothetical protein STH12_01423 [Shewanella khirikhana]
MPHLRIRGLEQAEVARLSETLPAALSRLTQTDESAYTTEWIPSQFFQQGKACRPTVMAEVLWFQRNEATQDAMEACIREQLMAYTQQGIAIVFIALDKRGYYRDGRHF